MVILGHFRDWNRRTSNSRLIWGYTVSFILEKKKKKEKKKKCIMFSLSNNSRNSPLKPTLAQLEVLWYLLLLLPFKIMIHWWILNLITNPIAQLKSLERLHLWIELCELRTNRQKNCHRRKSTSVWSAEEWLNEPFVDGGGDCGWLAQNLHFWSYFEIVKTTNSGLF